MIVVDTNVIASLWVPNDMEEMAYKVLAKDSDWIAPLLWRSEFRNVLAIYLRADILDFFTILQAAEEAEQLMASREFEVNSSQLLTFISGSTCSSYDCEFVTLADDLDIKLVTFDKKVLGDFPDIAIHPTEFAS